LNRRRAKGRKRLAAWGFGLVCPVINFKGSSVF